MKSSLIECPKRDRIAVCIDPAQSFAEGRRSGRHRRARRFFSSSERRHLVQMSVVGARPPHKSSWAAAYRPCKQIWTPITSRPGNSGFKLVEIIPAAPVVPPPAPAPAASAKVARIA